MELGITEAMFLPTILLIGFIGLIKQYANGKSKEDIVFRQVIVYGVFFIVFLSGLFTPPDVFSNLIVSVPSSIIYFLILKKLLEPNISAVEN